MDTFITVNLMTYTEEEYETHKENIEDIFSMYHELTNNYQRLSSDQTYLENIYTINQKIGQKLEIDKELYDILVEAEEIKVLTDGYFDISTGKAIDVWKALIEADFEDNIIPEVNYQSAIETINALDFSNNIINLTQSENKYYIETLGEDIKLDLGAFSKGYATQKVADYLEEQGITYYYISAGSSSLYLGSNSNSERDYFNIGLTCPVCSVSGSYGTLEYAQNLSVTTSGDYEQYVSYNNQRYHHIVSPVTKIPSHFYHTVTLAADDAGLLDALSTALFSMDPDTFDAWMVAHQDEYGISYVRYNIDGTISQSLKGSLVFEEVS
jgi:thiamine biosynthesis lipoprotein